MKKSRYTEEQIASALRQAESGTPVAEVIRKYAQVTRDSPASELSGLLGGGGAG
jgi:hypothetical protein